jgi:hypothetical protein
VPRLAMLSAPTKPRLIARDLLNQGIQLGHVAVHDTSYRYTDKDTVSWHNKTQLVKLSSIRVASGDRNRQRPKQERPGLSCPLVFRRSAVSLLPSVFWKLPEP